MRTFPAEDVIAREVGVNLRLLLQPAGTRYSFGAVWTIRSLLKVLASSAMSRRQIQKTLRRADRWQKHPRAQMISGYLDELEEVLRGRLKLVRY